MNNFMGVRCKKTFSGKILSLLSKIELESSGQPQNRRKLLIINISHVSIITTIIITDIEG